MGRIGIVLVLSGALLAGTAPAIAPESRLNITVWIHNHATTPELNLEQAKTVAARIFQHAGLTIEWVEPATAAGRPFREGDLVLRVVPESMIASWGLDASHLAFAIVPRTGTSSTIAGVIADRLEKTAARLRYPLGFVMGCVMAHELGHLLLGNKRHSNTGVMSFPVDRDYLRQASKGWLGFAPSQSRRIRSEAARRRDRQIRQRAD